MIFKQCRSFCVVAFTGLALFLPVWQAFAADVRHEAILKKGSVEWNAMRQKDPVTQTDLSGAVLKGRRLRKVDFSRTNLAGADISQADMGRADFRDADLHGARLDGSVLSGSRFVGAKMQRVSLAGASCSDADFNGAQMASSVLRRADFTNAMLRGADLSGADLREANLEHADLAKADLRAANLWLARAESANFNGAVVSDETVLPNGKTGSADWAAAHGAFFRPTVQAPEELPKTGSVTSAFPANTMPTTSGSSGKKPLAETLKPVRAWRPAPSTISYDADQLDLLRSNVMKWNRTRAANPAMTVRLNEAPLSNRVLAYADLHGALLEKASLKNTDLDRADLSGADLRGADLRSANLQKTDLRKADLRGADLWLASTGRARFDGAVVSSETVLDNGKKATRAWAAEHAALFSDDPALAR